ncbi:MAG: hypothetical protein A2X49_12275 [Lentisphaerae bacterium GWF2_52_8]|nr:MAG: hypothetical protein A2X49_12275 [Lentisphaerae bacterium GWF2_52_8]
MVSLSDSLILFAKCFGSKIFHWRFGNKMKFHKSGKIHGAVRRDLWNRLKKFWFSRKESPFCADNLKQT